MGLERKKTQVVGQFDLCRALRGLKRAGSGAGRRPGAKAHVDSGQLFVGLKPHANPETVTSGAKAPSFHGTYRHGDPGLKSWATSRALSKQLQSHSASSR